jgi:hypothetical protein
MHVSGGRHTLQRPEITAGDYNNKVYFVELDERLKRK